MLDPATKTVLLELSFHKMTLGMHSITSLEPTTRQLPRLMAEFIIALVADTPMSRQLATMS